MYYIYIYNMRMCVCVRVCVCPFTLTAQQINIPLLVIMNRKIKKPPVKLNFLAVTIKQRIKLVLQHSLCK